MVALSVVVVVVCVCVCVFSSFCCCYHCLLFACQPLPPLRPNAVVLSGRLKITAGAESFVSEAGAFSVLAADALTAPMLTPYVTDFTAAVMEHTRLVRITRDLYRQMLDKPEEALVPASPRLRRMNSAGRVRSDRWQRVADVMPALVRDSRAASEGGQPRDWLSLAGQLPLGVGAVAATAETTGVVSTAAIQAMPELQGMPVSGLKTKARRLGISEAALDEADDAPDVKQALILLITAEAVLSPELRSSEPEITQPPSPLHLGSTVKSIAEAKAKQLARP